MSRLGSGFAACLAATLVSTFALAVEAAADRGVDPGSVTLNLPSGGSSTVAKTVSTPPIPPKPDIVFLVDTTGSMGAVISNVQANAPRILNNVLAAEPSAEFAVAEYKDTADSAPFTVLQNLTADTSAVQTGIDNLTPVAGGGDFPEADINALYQVSTGAVTPRPGSSRLVVWIGDAPSHDPSNGHTLADAITALNDAHIRVMALDVGNLDASGQATAVTDATGGQLFSGISPDEVSDTILAGLSNLPVTVTHTLTGCDPTLDVSQAPSSRTVTSGTDATFSETIKVASEAVPGSTLTCTVRFLLNGSPALGFDETVTIHVPKASLAISTTPSGTVPAGGDESDTATLTGGFQPSGAVTFRLYGPGDTTCHNAIATRHGTISGGHASSGKVATGGVGTYRWTATYPGDAHNNGASSPCGAETVVVTKASPTISTKPSGTVPAGGTVSDTATVSGGFRPTGTVTFELFAPGDTSCADPIASRTTSLSDGHAASGTVSIGAAGTYNWTAAYSGDANNKPASSPCRSESVVVTPQTLTGRAYGLAAHATLLGIQLADVAPLPDTGQIETTSTGSTSVPCVATLRGLVSADVLCANVSTRSYPGKSVATASLDDTTIGLPGLPVITVRAIQSSSTTTCAGSSGTTTIAYLAVGNVVVISEPTPIAPNTTVDVGVVKLVLNEQRPVSGPDTGLTVNAIHLTVDALGLAKTNVTIASSESDIGTCP